MATLVIKIVLIAFQKWHNLVTLLPQLLKAGSSFEHSNVSYKILALHVVGRHYLFSLSKNAQNLNRRQCDRIFCAKSGPSFIKNLPKPCKYADNLGRETGYLLIGEASHVVTSIGLPQLKLGNSHAYVDIKMIVIVDVDVEVEVEVGVKVYVEVEVEVKCRG